MIRSVAFAALAVATLGISTTFAAPAGPPKLAVTTPPGIAVNVPFSVDVSITDAFGTVINTNSDRIYMSVNGVGVGNRTTVAGRVTFTNVRASSTPVRIVCSCPARLITKTVTVAAGAPPVITSNGSTTFNEGANGSFLVQTTGTPTPTITAGAAAGSSVPLDVTFTDNGDGTGTLSGIPQAGTAGDYFLTITAANGVGPNAVQTFKLTVSNAPQAFGVYVRDVAPWAPEGEAANVAAMTAVFGANWTIATFSTPVATIFGPPHTFVFLEGGDSNALELAAFLTANRTAIENWVAAGGKLFLNAAPNEGGNIDFGFGGVTLMYSDPGDNAVAVNVGHPIFSGPLVPVVTSYTGTNASHATVTGNPALVPILVNENNRFSLSELAFGSGKVLFGGLTTSNFWSPDPEAGNLKANIIAYTAN